MADGVEQAFGLFFAFVIKVSAGIGDKGGGGCAAYEWAELPNTAGMALFANGGRFTSKPYVASGAYVKRMSNYCSGCAYRPEVREGANACPMTTLYWNFLDQHEKAFAANPRTALMVKNLQRMTPAEREQIRAEANKMLANLDQL